VLERGAVLKKEALQAGPEAIALLGLREVVETDDERRIRDDAPLTVDLV
jgi:hypothetical protein